MDDRDCNVLYDLGVRCARWRGEVIRVYCLRRGLVYEEEGMGGLLGDMQRYCEVRFLVFLHRTILLVVSF